MGAGMGAGAPIMEGSDTAWDEKEVLAFLNRCASSVSQGTFSKHHTFCFIPPACLDQFGSIVRFDVSAQLCKNSDASLPGQQLLKKSWNKVMNAYKIIARENIPGALGLAIVFLLFHPESTLPATENRQY
jgi:hypothetical protein